ncbi:uncharacterized protein K452DRAFT_306969 [Aplosporella prunicola CBS 121167]|uniref:SCP domain-containing protein n=1 Tax=Aplosporella prunicola CBS 121167 TaxID=1176127 RepID=A0A6A6BHF0_9PEZI|nr:uncharacterized protein K452DRAFT_306969 [Aplosporella prunicola CBS 121167]KAF2143572.1 hypothetical protein K452DRAFT_306969 [Aplosporella prunicola CBS 121167]
MRSSTLVAATFAAQALAGPIAKRFLTTDWEFVTVTQTVTAGEGVPAGVQTFVTTMPASVTAQAVETEVAATTIIETQQAGAQGAKNNNFWSFFQPQTTEIVQTSAQVLETTIEIPPSVVASTQVIETTQEAPVPVATTAVPVAETTEVISTQAPATTEAPATTVAPATTQTQAASTKAATTQAATTAGSGSGSGFKFASICATPAASDMPSAARLAATPTGDVQKLWLGYHNVHRSNHTDTCSMYYDYDLEESAQEWANTCTYKHDTTIGSSYSASDDTTWYGQNGGMYSESLSDTKAAVMFTNMYYQEGQNYTNAYGAMTPLEGGSVPTGADIGHFTQMLWKESYAVGCASRDCSNVAGSSIGYVTWCNYRVTGNIQGEYATNVAKPISPALPPVCTDYDVEGCIAESEFI